MLHVSKPGIESFFALNARKLVVPGVNRHMMLQLPFVDKRLLAAVALVLESFVTSNVPLEVRLSAESSSTRLTVVTKPTCVRLFMNLKRLLRGQSFTAVVAVKYDAFCFNRNLRNCLIVVALHQIIPGLSRVVAVDFNRIVR